MNNDHANSNDSKKALVIAVSDYDNSSGLKSIEFCKNDGEEMYDTLKKNGYDIPDNHKLIGNVDSEKLKKTIYDFFTNEDNKPDDTLVFYYSGHGIPDKFGTTFLAPSNMDSDHPFITGFSFDDLTNSMLSSNSQCIVTILDSCFSGSLKISKSKGLDSKSGEEAATRIANNSIEEKSDKLKQGVGRCLLAASQGYEEAYDRQEKDHSIFTYYLLEGLKGHKNAVDDEGNVTYDTLGKFITREIGNLPIEKRPKQTPVRKGEVAGGEIILAKYPELRKTKESDYYTLFGKAEDYFRRGKYQESLECYDLIIKIQPNNEHALLRKGNILVKINEDKKALECFDQLIELNKNSSDAWYNKAKLNMKIKDYENALKCLDEASNIDPEDEKVWEAYRKVKSLMKSSGTKEEPEIIIIPPDETQKNDLSDINVLYTKGLTLYNQGKFQESIEYFDKVLKMEPNNESARYNRFLALERLSKEKSSSYYDKNTIDNVKDPNILTESDGGIIHQKKNLLQPPDQRTVVVRSDQFTSKDITKNYSFINSWGSKGKGDSEFNSPRSISVDSSSGDVYVADTNNHRIQKFDSNGKFITKWGSAGNREGQFKNPEGISVDSSSGDVYVADTNNHRIQKFDSNGNYIANWGSKGSKDGQFNYPIGISVDSSSGDVYVADTNNHRIQKFDSNGNFYLEWGSYGGKDGQFNYPRDITVDSTTGNVYVTHTGKPRIQKFDSNGKFITKWGSVGNGIGEFNSPIFIAVNPTTGNVYVADKWNDRIQKFDSNGKFITKWGSAGNREGQFKNPEGISVDSSSGDVYVADTNNHRIQVMYI